MQSGAEQESRHRPPGTQRTVLIADDELHLVNVLARLFTRQGFRVITALNGKQALERALEHRPCLVLTDMLMPQMSGAEVCEQLKATPEAQATRVMIMSSLPQYAVPRCGADGYIAKPFAVNDLIGRVQALLK